MKVPLNFDYLNEEQKQPSAELKSDFLLDINLDEVIENKPRTKKRKKNKKEKDVTEKRKKDEIF